MRNIFYTMKSFFIVTIGYHPVLYGSQFPGLLPLNLRDFFLQCTCNTCTRNDFLKITVHNNYYLLIFTETSFGFFLYEGIRCDDTLNRVKTSPLILASCRECPSYLASAEILGRKINHTDSLCRKLFSKHNSLGKKQEIADNLGGSHI